MRIGFGFDVHRRQAGRPLILGGVEIPGVHGLIGHSDADVVAHAVIDALLGAIGAADIGAHFPDDDPSLAGISSLVLLRRTADLLAEADYGVANIDVTVILEEPKISPYREKMRAQMATALSIDDRRVNIKATTTEGLGFCGRGAGIAAAAVALLNKIKGRCENENE